jgi:hypothetical protein
MKLEKCDLKDVVMKLMVPRDRACPHVINNHHSSKPWHLFNVVYRDNLGRRNGDACAWLEFHCWSCQAVLYVRANSIAESLPPMLDVKR